MSEQELPLPPLEMREVVGPTDPAAFDNPDGAPIFPDLPPRAYDSVFDFGCGCGRLARQLIQQQPRPRRYVGVDLHPVLIGWCKENLGTRTPGFVFRHHDVHHPGWNPGEGKPAVAPFPVADDSCTLAIAHSVFTHLIQGHAEYYLEEVARILAPGGVFEATWFIFEKRFFPMMQEFQNALYVNEVDPTNATIFDRGWLGEIAADKGLAITGATPPSVRGYHWRITMTPVGDGVDAVDLPKDTAPFSVEGTRAAAIVPDLAEAGRAGGQAS